MNDNEIKRWLTGRAVEYMMFNYDEEDTEVPEEILSTDANILKSRLMLMYIMICLKRRKK